MKEVIKVEILDKSKIQAYLLKRYNECQDITRQLGIGSCIRNAQIPEVELTYSDNTSIIISKKFYDKLKISLSPIIKVLDVTFIQPI